jgi:hypothetical protein
MAEMPEETRKGRALRRDRHVALTVQDERPPRWVAQEAVAG